MKAHHKKKRPWTRGEKWLLASPLFLLLCAYCVTAGREALRRHMGWPKRVIAVPDLRGNRELLRLFDVSDEGQILVGRGGDPTLYFFNVENGEETDRLTIQSAAARNGSLYDCRFLKGGSQVVVSSMTPQMLQIWDVREQREVGKVPAVSYSCNISPGDPYIATSASTR